MAQVILEIRSKYFDDESIGSEVYTTHEVFKKKIDGENWLRKNDYNWNDRKRCYEKKEWTEDDDWCEREARFIV